MRDPLKRSAIWLMVRPPLFRTMNRVLNKVPIIFTLHRRANPEHGIGGHDPNLLRKQLCFLLENRYQAVTMDVIEAWTKGAEMDMTNTVAFTFDDGYRDQAELIREIFIPLGVPATMFLITGFVDGKLWPWDARISWLIQHASPTRTALDLPWTPRPIRIDGDREKRRALTREIIKRLQHRPPETLEAAIGQLSDALRLTVPLDPPESHASLTWKEARKMEKMGVRFGAHTRDHYILSTLDHEESRRQIHASQQRLQAELEKPLQVFAYPIGNRSDYTGRECKTLAELGYAAAVTMSPGVVKRPTESGRFRPFFLNRFSLPDQMADFLRYVSWIGRLDEHARAVSPGRFVRDRYGHPRALLALLKNRIDYRLGRLMVSRPVDWSKVQRFVFVCQGNVCRSPFAEAVANVRGLPSVSFGLETDSGTPVNPIASRVALEMGIDITAHTSQRFDIGQVRQGDLILGMEPLHLRAVADQSLARKAQISLLGLHLDEASTPLIADPYGLSDAYYRRCLGLIQTAVEAMARTWFTSQPTKPSTTVDDHAPQATNPRDGDDPHK